MTITLSEERSIPAYWAIDHDNTLVEFSAKTFWGLFTVHGRFERFDGSYEVGPGGARIEMTVDADSLDTGNTTRDKHLRSADFFHTAEHAQVRFTSTRVDHVDDGTLRVEGTLEAAGKVMPLDFSASQERIGDALQIETTLTLDQRQLGMSSGKLGMIRSPVRLHVRARLNETLRRTPRLRVAFSS